MLHKFVLGAVLAVGAVAAAPTGASAQGIDFALDIGEPAYGYGEAIEPVYHRRWHRGGYGYYGYRPYYRPRPYYGYRPYRPRCRTVSVRSWNGYRYVTRVRETCGRRYYSY